jgi:hypothetical protein
MELYPDDLPTGSSVADRIAHEKRCDDALNVRCLMLAIMFPDLQKQYEHADAYTMIQGLRGIFENQASSERYNISKVLFACKLAEGSPINPHVIKMMCGIETLDKLGSELKDDLIINVILQSLLVSYESFSINFHMNDVEKFVAELYGMLKIANESIKKNSNHVIMVQKEKKRGSVRRLPRVKATKRFSMSPQAQSLRHKVALLLMRNASTATKRDISSGNIRSTWRSQRRREVRLPLQV